MNPAVSPQGEHFATLVDSSLHYQIPFNANPWPKSPIRVCADPDGVYRCFCHSSGSRRKNLTCKIPRFCAAPVMTYCHPKKRRAKNLTDKILLAPASRRMTEYRYTRQAPNTNTNIAADVDFFKISISRVRQTALIWLVVHQVLPILGHTPPIWIILVVYHNSIDATEKQPKNINP